MLYSSSGFFAYFYGVMGDFYSAQSILNLPWY